MMEAKDIARKVGVVQELLRLKFGIKHAPLQKMSARAGRRIPKRVQTKVKMLIVAQEQSGHPKLARLLDEVALAQAFDEVITHLKGVDISDRRRGKMLSLAGNLAFNLLFVVAAFIVWLWWRGYV